jgi:uncharacterized RDD family membrane protein YckC
MTDVQKTNVTYVSWGTRVWITCFDGAVVLVCSGLAALPAAFLNNEANPVTFSTASNSGTSNWRYLLAAGLLALLYPILSSWLYGSTFGMRLLSDRQILVVRSRSGRRPNLLQAVLRVIVPFAVVALFFLSVVPAIAVSLLYFLLIPVIDRRHRTPGDLISGTALVATGATAKPIKRARTFDVPLQIPPTSPRRLMLSAAGLSVALTLAAALPIWAVALQYRHRAPGWLTTFATKTPHGMYLGTAGMSAVTATLLAGVAFVGVVVSFTVRRVTNR